MNKRHNRAVLAQRAIQNGRTGASPCTTVASNVALRTVTVQAGGNLRNRKAVKLTGAQRDSQGNRSAWADSPYYFTDPKWDQTVTSQHVGTGGFR